MCRVCTEGLEGPTAARMLFVHRTGKAVPRRTFRIYEHEYGQGKTTEASGAPRRAPLGVADGDELVLLDFEKRRPDLLHREVELGGVLADLGPERGRL